MYKLITTTAVAALLSACATPPVAELCDREAQEYDKFGTPLDECAVPLIAAPLALIVGDPNEDPDGNPEDYDPDDDDDDDPDDDDDEEHEDPDDDEDDDDEDEEDPDHPVYPVVGQNPGNGKPVGKSPFDGITGNSGQNNPGPPAAPMNGQRDDLGPQPGGGTGPSG